MSINDVVIHIDETLDSRVAEGLEEQMRDLDGVIAARINRNTSHLMVVAYDPERLSTLDIIDNVRSRGFHAQHCGA